MCSFLPIRYRQHCSFCRALAGSFDLNLGTKPAITKKHAFLWSLLLETLPNRKIMFVVDFGISAFFF